MSLAPRFTLEGDDRFSLEPETMLTSQQQTIAGRHLSPEALQRVRAGQQPLRWFLEPVESGLIPPTGERTPVQERLHAISTQRAPTREEVLAAGYTPQMLPRYQALIRGLGESVVAGGPGFLPGGAIAETTGIAQRELGRRIGARFAQTPQRVLTEHLATAPPSISPVSRVIDALKAAKPVRAAQEALYSAERGRRIAASEAVGKTVSGQAGYFARLGSLGGELPKAKFTPLEVSQTDKDALFDRLANSPLLNGYSIPRAMSGLQKLLQGSVVPQEGELQLLGRVFGTDFVQAVKTAGVGRLQRVGGLAGQALGVFRSLMTFWDYSAPFRQAVFVAPRYARIFARNFKPMFEASFRAESEQAIAEEIAKRPTYALMDRGGLSLSVIDRIGVSREEAFAASDLASRIPGIGRLVRASNRAYSAFLSKTRADIFDAILSGVPKAPATLTDAELSAIAGFVNTVTGRGNLGVMGKFAGELSTTIFAPRLMASRLSIINPVYYARLDPIVRKEALKTALTAYGSLTTVLGVTAAAGAKVSLDYRNADFGKISIPASTGIPAATIRMVPAVFGVGTQTYAGRTRYDVSGGILNYIRLIGQLVSGETVSSVTGLPKTVRGRPLTRYEILKDFVENKFSPVASAIREFMDRENRPRAYPYNITEEVVSRVTPMVIGDWYELTQGGEESLGQAVDRWIRGTRRVPYAP